MYERESTAVEGSVGVIVVCFLLSCITQDEAGRDFGARCACFSATTCSGGGDLSLSDAIRDWRRGGGGGWGWWVHRRRGQELVALLSGPAVSEDLGSGREGFTSGCPGGGGRVVRHCHALRTQGLGCRHQVFLNTCAVRPCMPHNGRGGWRRS